MADRPLARPFLLSRQLLSRRPLSLVSRAFSLVNNVRRQHRPMANPRLRLALVQRSPVIPMASSSQSGSSWRQAQMVWLGKAISYEQGVEDLPMPAPVRVPSPGAATRPAVARRTAEIPAPPAQFSPRARPRVAVQASPQPTPTVDAPPGVEAPEQESGGLVRGSDMWQRLFPERSSFLQGIREKDVARKQERTMKRPPPVIPSKLPRTRTWEITPVELAKPAVPVSPPSAAVDQTIARDPEDASQAPEPEEDARTSPRAGPPKADSAAVQRLSAAAEPSAAVKRDLYDVRQGQDDRPAEPDGVSVVEEATGVDVRLSHPAPAVDRKVEAKSPTPVELPASRAPVEQKRAPAPPRAESPHAGEATAAVPAERGIGELGQSLESAPPSPVETVSPGGEAPVVTAAIAPAEIQAKRTSRSAAPAGLDAPRQPGTQAETPAGELSAATPEVQAAPAEVMRISQVEVESSPMGAQAESPPVAPPELDATRPSRAVADGLSVGLPAGGGAAAPPSIQTEPASPDAPRGLGDTEAGSPVEAPAVERALTPPDIQASRAKPETARPSQARAKSQAPARKPPAALPEVQAKDVSEPDRVEPDTIAAPVDRQGQAREAAPLSGGRELMAAPAEAPVEGVPQPVEPAAVSPPPISRQVDPAIPRIDAMPAAPAGEGQQEAQVGQERDRRRVRVQLTLEEQALPAVGAAPPRVQAATPAKVQDAIPAKVQDAIPARVQVEPVEQRVPPTTRGDNGPVHVQAKSIDSGGQVVVGPDAESRPRFSPMPLWPGGGAAPIGRLADGGRATTQSSVPRKGVESESEIGVPTFRPALAKADPLPLHVPAVVQRTDDQRSTTTFQMPSLPTREQSFTTEYEDEDEDAQEFDTDQLAREVYAVLKRRLIVEREQFWGY